MVRVVDVFTPSDVPTITYVERATRRFEETLRKSLEIPKMIVSISGPSKSGKSVLLHKVLDSERIISVSGASIRSADDLWEKTLNWMDAPSGSTRTLEREHTFDASVTAGGKAGIPLVAQGKVEGTTTFRRGSTDSLSETRRTGGITQVVREVSGSDFVIVIDDFHYIPREIQSEIGRQIKEASENGVRICTASVPHRSDDVVRSNTELRGRVTAIDTDYWAEEELSPIANLGFAALNVELSFDVLSAITKEAFGSPQLMQAICLNFCYENGIEETLPAVRRFELKDYSRREVLERTSALTDFSTMLSALHAGPKQRGTERKQFDFTDGSRGDVYRCILLAMRSDPPRLSFNYDDITKRARSVCVTESPVGSAVSEALSQMHRLATSIQVAPILEWDEDVLDIVEPYFLFFLRCSSYLEKLRRR